MWRRKSNATEIDQEALHMFELQLQNQKTDYHMENHDAYNTVEDKTVQHHKMTKRMNEWLDPEKNGQDCHENRFTALPYNGLPEVHSKNARVQSLNMEKPTGRNGKIYDLVKSEVVQLVPVENEAQYEYDLDKTLAPLDKLTKFQKSERFDNKGIFGDTFDQRKENRFGQPKLSTINPDKANEAKDQFSMKKVQDPRPFESYVTKDVSSFEGKTGTLMVDTIFDNSPTGLRSQCGFNFKAYKKLKEFQEQLPVLDRVNHKDYLPNFIKNKINKRASISHV